MATTSTTKMTVEEFLALPEEDGVYRELIDGELRETPMPTRNSKHSLVTGRITQSLWNWLDDQTDLAGVVVNGDARCRLAPSLETIVGIDVALFLGAEFVDMGEQVGVYDGPPTIAVEVLSPTDMHENIAEKVNRYLNANVPQVWIADPDFDTILVHRPGRDPTLFTRSQFLNAEPELPGFRVSVALLFRGKRSQSK
jgi:Uma2 family endonuclease